MVTLSTLSFNKGVSVVLFHGYNVGISLMNNILLNRLWLIHFSSSNSDAVAEQSSMFLHLLFEKKENPKKKDIL